MQEQADDRGMSAARSPKGAPVGGTPTDALLRLVADAVPALMAYYELPTLKCRFANLRYAQYNGWTPETILGHTVREVIGEPAWQVIEPHVNRVLQGQEAHYRRPQMLPGGEQRMIDVKLIPHFADNQVQLGAFVLINDITDAWRAEQEIRDSETRMRKFVQATEEGIVFHKDGVITDANAAMARMVGHTVEELIGLHNIDFIPEAWRQTVVDNIRNQYEQPYEAALIHRDGHVIPVEFVGKTMPHHGEVFRLTVVRDITARKQAQERIEFLAWHDPLTELPNRLYLNEYLTRTLALAGRQRGSLAVLFIDLDEFKNINDTLGHQAGDHLLRAMATRLKTTTRQADLVARLGGDEFLVVLTDVAEPRDVARVAATLLETLRAQVEIAGRAVSVAPSIGISLFPEDGNTADDLISHADAAMYRVKAAGGSHYAFFSPEPRADA